MQSTSAVFQTRGCKLAAGRAHDTAGLEEMYRKLSAWSQPTIHQYMDIIIFMFITRTLVVLGEKHCCKKNHARQVAESQHSLFKAATCLLSFETKSKQQNVWF